MKRAKRLRTGAAHTWPPAPAAPFSGRSPRTLQVGTSSTCPTPAPWVLLCNRGWLWGVQTPREGRRGWPPLPAQCLPLLCGSSWRQRDPRERLPPPLPGPEPACLGPNGNQVWASTCRQPRSEPPCGSWGAWGAREGLAGTGQLGAARVTFSGSLWSQGRGEVWRRPGDSAPQPRARPRPEPVLGVPD